MASPFTIFRKNQRAMMAVVGILCMIGFTIGGVASSMLDSRRPTGTDAVVVTTVNGPIRESELQRMRESRRMLNRFMGELIRVAYPKELDQRIWQLTHQVALDQQFGPDMEEDVVLTAVFANRAKRMGIVITDEAINDMLRKSTENKVSPEQFAKLVDNLNLSQPLVFEALRTVVLARSAMRMTSYSTQVTPAQRWDYYQRVNQKAEAEVLPLDVEDFIVQDSDPSEDEMRSFFEKRKETEPDPQSPEFGFKIPKKAAFRYFVAKYEAFYDEADVADDEIKKYYEENKDRLYRFTSLSDDDADAEANAPGSDGESKSEGTPEPEGEKPDESKAADETASPEAPGSLDASDASTPPSDEPTPDSETPNEPEADSQSSVPDSGKNESFRVLAFRGRKTDAGTGIALRPGEQLAYYAAQDDDPIPTEVDARAIDGERSNEADTGDTPESDFPESNAPERDAPEDDDMPTSTSDVEASADQPSERADEGEAAADEPADQSPARKTPGKPRATSEPQKAPPPITSDLLLIRDIREGPKPEYDPLWKVEASIRKELAGQKAVAKMKAELQSIQKEFRRYLRNLSEEDDQDSTELDYEALAKQHGMHAHSTELLSRYEMESEHPDLVGATLDQEGFMTARRFADVAYILPLDQSHLLRDLEGNRILFWKIKEEDAHVPTFEESRQDVLRAWKLQQARELALEEARRMAEKAEEAKKPLADVFSERAEDVKQIGPFSWMVASPMDATHRGMAIPVMSEVEGVQSPGDEFMRTVFSLPEGGVGAALNKTQAVAYVVRVEGYSKSLKGLQALFMSQNYDRYARAGEDDLRRAYKAWRAEVEREDEIEWKRPADEPPVKTAMK